MGTGVAVHRNALSTVGWVAPPLLIVAVLYTLQHTSESVTPRIAQQILRRDEEARCPVDLILPGACEEVKKYCSEFDSDGLIPYARAYACTPESLRPALLFGLLIWLVVLFASMATAASDFLAVHLQYIVKTVGISEHLAGVTVFAFGNGCTDLFSTFAAMGANSGSLAISELFGAAAFITTVVLGLIVLIQPFPVDPREFIGDVVWFIIAASLLITFIADGQLVLGECLGIIGLYLSFICFALLRSRKLEQLAISETVRGSYTDDAIGEGQGDHLLELNTDDAANSSDTNSIHSSQVGDMDPALINKLTTPSGDGQAEQRGLEDHSSEARETEAFNENAEVSVASTALQSVPTIPILRSFPPLYTWHEQTTGERVFALLGLPLLFPIGLTTPPCVIDDFNVERTVSSEIVNNSLSRTPATSRSWHTTSMTRRLKTCPLPNLQSVKRNWLLCLQVVLGPQLFTLVIMSLNMEASRPVPLMLGSLGALIASVIFMGYILSTASQNSRNLSISTLAFVTSLMWIYLTATSAVSLLIALAWILDIPTSLLGATVFAVGQSSNDLFANTAIAKRGMPVLAASATFGGPMMNMLIGIGVGGLVQVLKSGSKGAYTFEMEAGLFVSATCLLLGLIVTLGWAFMCQWRLERGLGVTLIILWSVFAVINVAVSMAF